tara:strand:- start:595 stop:1032 length:438 start_codon:yes stop_codon:yes gene_type:complete
MKKLKLLTNKYNYCKDIIWEDVIRKIEDEFKCGTHRFLPSKEYAPTFVLHNRYFPNTIQKVYDKVKEFEGIDEMHIYTSLGRGSPTFGTHKDNTDVLIVQSIGRMIYVIENKEYLLNPGDGLVIPCGVYHSPLVMEPRVTLSFSW